MEADVIDSFVSHLAATECSGLQLDRRPDVENRTSSDIDAIAGRFAIEHTSIDALPNQRRDADWFMQAAGGIEGELERMPPFRIRITLEYDAVKKGQHWRSIRESLKRWIYQEAPGLRDGRTIIETAEGIPFRMHILKESNRTPRVFLSRYAPADATLATRVKGTFNRKASKLLPYQSQNFTTILLIESDDPGLMCEVVMMDAIEAAFPSGIPVGVDRIWYADTSIPGYYEFNELTRMFQALPNYALERTREG